MSSPFQKPPPQQPRVTTSAPSPRQEQPYQESIPFSPGTLRFHFTPMHGLLAVVVLLLLAIFWYAMSAPRAGPGVHPVPSPALEITPAPATPKSPMAMFAESRGFRTVQPDVAFVKKDIYGGDLEYNAILRGKVRNVSNRAYQNVLVLWVIYDEQEKPLRIVNRGEWESAVFLDKVDYLDTKAEADFNIRIDLYGGVGAKSAERIREALRAGREEAGLFLAPEPKPGV